MVQKSINFVTEIDTKDDDLMVSRVVSIQLPSFENPELLRTIQRHFYDTSLEKARIGAPSPSKRARISRTDVDAPRVKRSSDLMAKIALLLSVDIQADFESLSRIIVYVISAVWWQSF